jgi:lysophospholipase L1-like esterase
VIVLLAGTNNVGNKLTPQGLDVLVDDVTRGIGAVLREMRARAPKAVIILTAIFPRNDNMEVMPEINAINRNLENLADGRRISFLNINDRLADPDRKLYDGMMNPKDRLHLIVKGYPVWADALKPLFAEILGPPAKEDRAPPPTGNPAAMALH